MSNHGLRVRGSMERRITVGIARAIAAGVVLFMILDFFALPTWMSLAIFGSLLAGGGVYLHLLVQARIADAVLRIADAVLRRAPGSSASSNDTCDSGPGTS